MIQSFREPNLLERLRNAPRRKVCIRLAISAFLAFLAFAIWREARINRGNRFEIYQKFPLGDGMTLLIERSVYPEGELGVRCYYSSVVGNNAQPIFERSFFEAKDYNAVPLFQLIQNKQDRMAGAYEVGVYEDLSSNVVCAYDFATSESIESESPQSPAGESVADKHERLVDKLIRHIPANERKQREEKESSQ